MTIYEKLKATGAPLDNHESDLYVKVTPETERILRGQRCRFTRFKSEKDGCMWFDVPFAFDPFWAKRTTMKGE